MGIPVDNAKTQVNFKKNGKYKVWVRTTNWVPGEWEAPGRFQLKVNDLLLENTLGQRSGWGWEYAGAVQVTNKKNTLELVDLTGFNGRCDAIYFTTSNLEPPTSMKKLDGWIKVMA